MFVLDISMWPEFSNSSIYLIIKAFEQKINFLGLIFVVWWCMLSQNIMRILNVLIYFPFTTCKIEMDHCYYKLNIQVASWVSKQLWIKGSGNILQKPQNWGQV